MMNPYAAPGLGGSGEMVPQDPGVYGCSQAHPNMLTWKQGASLPDRCVKCNAPAHGFKLSKTFYWHEGWVYLMIFLGLLIYAVVALAVRKQATIAFGLCPKHKQQRTTGLIIAWGGFLLGMGLMFVGASMPSGGVIIGALLMMVIGPVVGLIMAKTIQPKRIDQHYAHMRVGDAFLASLPTHDPGPPGAWQGQMQGGYGYPGQPGYGQPGYGQFGHGGPPPAGGYGGDYGPR